MKLAARLLRVVLTAALLAPSPAFAQMRASVPGASAGAPTSPFLTSFGRDTSSPYGSVAGWRGYQDSNLEFRFWRPVV